MTSRWWCHPQTLGELILWLWSSGSMPGDLHLDALGLRHRFSLPTQQAAGCSLLIRTSTHSHHWALQYVCGIQTYRFLEIQWLACNSELCFCKHEFPKANSVFRVVTNLLCRLIIGDFGMIWAVWHLELEDSELPCVAWSKFPHHHKKSWNSEFHREVLIAFLWLYPMWLCSPTMCAPRGTVCALSGTGKSIGWSKLAEWGSFSQAMQDVLTNTQGGGVIPASYSSRHTGNVWASLLKRKPSSLFVNCLTVFRDEPYGDLSMSL